MKMSQLWSLALAVVVVCALADTEINRLTGRFNDVRVSSDAALDPEYYYTYRSAFASERFGRPLP